MQTARNNNEQENTDKKILYSHFQAMRTIHRRYSKHSISVLFTPSNQDGGNMLRPFLLEKA